MLFKYETQNKSKLWIFAPIKHNYTFNMFWHFVACESGNKDRSNLYFWGVPNPLDDDQRSIAATVDRPWIWSILAIKQVMTLVKFLWKKNICWLCCKKWKILNRKYGLERRNLRWEVNVIEKKIRSILGGIICMGGCTHIWHTLTRQMAA